MALETKPAKDPAAEDKHELDPKRKAALDTALAQVEKSFGKVPQCDWATSPSRTSR